jgi:hypothetical protein
VYFAEDNSALIHFATRRLSITPPAITTTQTGDRPMVKENENFVLAVRFPSKLAKKIEAAAAREYLAPSTWARTVLARAVEAKEQKAAAA